MKLKRLMLASMVATACCFGGAMIAGAQSTDQVSSGPPDNANSADGAPDSSTPPQDSDSAQQLPVLAVTNVEVLKGAEGATGGGDVVRVHGMSSTQGWSNAELFPITRGTPSDGILDLVLVAAPAGSHEANGFGAIDALLPIDAGHPYKGVRVRSAGNALTVKTIPGTAEAKPPGEDCSKCIGKVFVAKGEKAPSGVTAGEVVKQDDLTTNLRVVLPVDGVGDFHSDPNRLTLVIGEDGKIVDAAWD